MSPETGHFYEFGNFRLDPSAKVLFCEDKPVSLTPKVFETLQVFLEHAGRLLEKDELMQRLWQDRFVEESNLTFNIKMLRRALKDDAHEPRFIETVPRRGYRFIAKVKESFPDIKAKTEPDRTDSIYPLATAGGSDRVPKRSFARIAAFGFGYRLNCDRSVVWAKQICHFRAVRADSVGAIQVRKVFYHGEGTCCYHA